MDKPALCQRDIVISNKGGIESSAFWVCPLSSPPDTQKFTGSFKSNLNINLLNIGVYNIDLNNQL